MESSAFLAEVKRQIEEQHALDNAKMLIEKVNDHCFERCVPKPGSALSSSEQTCATQCIGKYMLAWNQVSISYIGRVKREQVSR
ncbi:Tim10/DDP family zinc finger-domain-containing protein [Annulohypoxylon truncatum]|uniref:Tim10/DDP family zinc finger-domain-containing protein n=1 Tax=Annulohypoxylon truncatum TaxID=327061 RepID=UPI0020086988|nr:Tim10/DDP family zinc finger-domain-containing protein [Annulohypoxylon truncatum]KAI1212492.1 Tim10/DDP family zinc finger-domain-containing protein [Annulohypoxylon truncatum]